MGGGSVSARASGDADGTSWKSGLPAGRGIPASEFGGYRKSLPAADFDIMRRVDGESFGVKPGKLPQKVVDFRPPLYFSSSSSLKVMNSPVSESSVAVTKINK